MATPKKTPTAAAANPATRALPPAAEPEKQSADAPENTIPALRVSAKAAGFRRAGRAWSVAPVEIALSDLTDEQISQIKGEPKLAVTEITLPAGA